MKRNVWIFNHYATNMFMDKDGRHYMFAKYLLEAGYKPTIFCASTVHNSDNKVELGRRKYLLKTVDNIPFVFVRTSSYNENDISRIKNMVYFYKNLFPVTKEYSQNNSKPDVILASSVHPLTLVAGIKIANRFNVKCICEVRDLWPESFIAYDILNKKNPLLYFLYAGEKKIYQKADKLIFTMEGGRDYIIEHKWDKEHEGTIDLNKVHHINNGVDLTIYDKNKNLYTTDDKDLSDKKCFKVVYTGSIRHVNKVGKILDVAKLLSNQNVKFLLWGTGDEVDVLKRRVKDEKINNVVFKGYVDKKYIPYITSNADLNIILGENLPLFRYGGSLNKMFDYFASGKPTLATFTLGYSLIDRYRAGMELDNNNPEIIADSILYFKDLDKKKYDDYCNNARHAAEDYDFKKLTSSLIKIIEQT